MPVAVSVFPDEVYQAPRHWAEKAYANLIYYKRLEKGGHFAACKQPKAFTDELRAASGAFGSLAETTGLRIARTGLLSMSRPCGNYHWHRGNARIAENCSAWRQPHERRPQPR